MATVYSNNSTVSKFTAVKSLSKAAILNLQLQQWIAYSNSSSLPTSVLSLQREQQQQCIYGCGISTALTTALYLQLWTLHSSNSSGLFTFMALDYLHQHLYISSCSSRLCTATTAIVTLYSKPTAAGRLYTPLLISLSRGLWYRRATVCLPQTPRIVYRINSCLSVYREEICSQEQ